MTDPPKNLAQSLRHTYVETLQPVQVIPRPTQPKERTEEKAVDAVDPRQEGVEQHPQTPVKVAKTPTKEIATKTPVKKGSPEEASPQPSTAKKFVRPEIENRVAPVPGVQMMEPQDFKALWDKTLARRSNCFLNLSFLSLLASMSRIEALFPRSSVLR